jgi:predicted TIM-barrel fold metal-dependent hydrolase
MMHAALQAARDNDLTVVFHTGLQAGGMNLVEDTKPTHLTNLFMEYRDLRFDLLHAGYPYAHECGVLGKYFPNVWVDLAWIHVITGAGTQQFLLDWLDLVPGSKILGFGSDTLTLENIYGALEIAKENLSAVLAERVRRGWDTMEEARELAWRMLRANPIECYRLDLEP